MSYSNKRKYNESYSRSSKRTRYSPRRTYKWMPKSYTVRRPYQWLRFGRYKGQSVPQTREYMEFRNTYATTLTSTGAGLMTGELCRLTDCYDAFGTGAANTQPLGYDQMASLYGKYQVWNATCRIMVTSLPTSLAANIAAPLVMVVWLSRSSTDVTTLREAQCQPGAITKIIPPYQITNATSTSITPGPPVVFTKKMDLTDWLSKDEQALTLTNASPTDSNNVYVNYWCSFMDGTALSNTIAYFAVNMDLRQHTEVVRRTVPIPVS